jgi:hypothetical protein
MRLKNGAKGRFAQAIRFVGSLVIAFSSRVRYGGNEPPFLRI